MIYETRLISEDEIVAIVRTLLSNGFMPDDIPVHLAKIVPFDADLLVEIIRKFAKSG